MDAATAMTVGMVAVAALPPAGLLAYGLHRQWRATAGRRDGFATGRTVARSVSEAAVRRAGAQTRPTLARPWDHPAAAFGRRLGRTVRPQGGRAVYATWEDTLLVLAPPRGGKTALLGHEVIDAPGAVLVTSTKVDIHTLTAPLRAARGPVWVLNPEGMNGLGSTLAWSPIPGCKEPARAIATAAYLVAGARPGHGASDEAFWENQNAKVLRCLLYAADVADLGMRQLAAWVTDPACPAPRRILTAHPATPPGWREVLDQLATATPEKTRQSVYLTLQQVVEFMADPALAAAVDPAASVAGERCDLPSFDIGEFVAGRGSLYLLGSAKPYGGMGPLFTALTGLIFEEAKRASQATPAGRLDPPLALVLDEATNICPVPLPQWAADAGGRGIALTTAIQSPSQLVERWGAAGADTIWQSATAKLILAGLSVPDDLRAVSDLLGHRDEPAPVPFHPQAHRAAPSIRRVPVLDPAHVRGLGRDRALLLYRGLPPIELATRPVWTRRDVRAARAGSTKPSATESASTGRFGQVFGAGEREGR